MGRHVNRCQLGEADMSAVILRSMSIERCSMARGAIFRRWPLVP